MSCRVATSAGVFPCLFLIKTLAPKESRVWTAEYPAIAARCKEVFPSSSLKSKTFSNNGGASKFYFILFYFDILKNDKNEEPSRNKSSLFCDLGICANKLRRISSTSLTFPEKDAMSNFP